jgi:UDP:flavonoid glycosyltransferase YjiC (YdhE family)
MARKMKKVLIHQPYKYGDFINLIPMVQKLHTIGYNVIFPHSTHTRRFNSIHTKYRNI